MLCGENANEVSKPIVQAMIEGFFNESAKYDDDAGFYSKDYMEAFLRLPLGYWQVLLAAHNYPVEYAHELSVALKLWPQFNSKQA